ncbi:NUDIX hydrolase [Roseibium limicola]|nr:NUDIX hydrolase [Roseibium limicola]
MTSASVASATMTPDNEQAERHPYKRPKDAATLLILDRTEPTPKVLMGRRHQDHVFMPGKFVFPGGRVDPTDSRTPVVGDYHPGVTAKLSLDLKGPKSKARVRALGIAAIRETYEEAGLFIGDRHDGPRPLKLGKGFEAFSELDIVPNLSPIRFIGRAITPPNRSRRFDTRFLAVDAGAVAHRLASGTGPTGELEELAWLPLDDAMQLDSLPSITRQILMDLNERLVEDSQLSPETPVPFYFFRNGRFERRLL